MHGMGVKEIDGGGKCVLISGQVRFVLLQCKILIGRRRYRLIISQRSHAYSDLDIRVCTVERTNWAVVARTSLLCASPRRVELPPAEVVSVSNWNVPREQCPLYGSDVDLMVEIRIAD